jgi:putative sigma-54 modulation protein
MRLILTGRHIEITDELKGLVEKKVVRLERLLNTRGVSGQVELSLEKFRHVVEIHIHARGGHMLQCRGVSTSWSESLADATDRIVQQVETLKGRWETRKRDERPARRSPAARAAGPLPANTARRIVRAKRYAVKAMSVDEAAIAVGPNEDAFVVFRNPVTDQVNVMFRRRDGDLGLIEPRA